MHRRAKLADFFLIRSPRLPINIFDKINNQYSESEFWEIAVLILKDRQILDAISIASRDLFNSLVPLLTKPFNDEIRKLLPTIYKYLSRMAIRPTPFGKFASISVGNISDEKTKLVLGSKLYSKFRLDYSSQEKINKQFLESAETIDKIIFYPNTTLTSNRETISYIEYDEHNSERSFNWAKINSNPLITLVIDLAKYGTTITSITKSLIGFGITEVQAKKFIQDLMSFKILIPEIEPITTNDHPEYFFKNALNISKGSKFYGTINEISEILYQLQRDNESLSFNISSDAFPEILGENPKNLFQVDMKRDMESSNLNIHYIEKLIKEIFELKSLNNQSSSIDLQSFCKRFTLRYSDQEIPLMEALDFENGIGYGVKTAFFEKDCPLLKGISKFNNETIIQNKSFVQITVENHLKNSEQVEYNIELTDRDFDYFKSKKISEDKILPIGFYAFGNLLKTKSVDKGFRFHLKSCGGTSGLPLITRFSYLDENLKSKLEKFAQAEQDLLNEAILAEIVFYPKGKAGNILSRPSLYKYEIPIIGQSSVDKEHTILLEDIVLSVKNERVVLRSKRLNKIIFPRLSSAHNFHYGMTIYRFLCDVQHQGNPLQISWTWDWDLISTRTFVPRVTYKHVILSRAKWYIKREELKLKSSQNDKETVQSLISKYQLPNRVLIADGDNEILIDLRHDVGCQIILKELSKKNIVLIENIYDAFDSPLTSSDGDIYTNEIIIPIIGESPIVSSSFSFSTEKNTIKRLFFPGSEWLYVKVYCGEREGDKLIREEFYEIVQKIKTKGLIQKWFFIRYSDPEPHLRMRFQLKDELDNSFLEVSKCIKNILGPLIQQRRISHFLFDTYERELERYGTQNIENCELIFNIESETIMKLLPFIKEDGEQLRWKIALIMLTNLLSAFESQVSEKINFLELLLNKFLIEFDMIPKLKHKLDLSFREYKAEIHSSFSSMNYKINIILREHQIQLKAVIAKLKESKDFKSQPQRIMSSLTHMLLNRIFFTNQRKQEMVIYHFLLKFLKTEINRQNYSKLLCDQETVT